jgi:imidazole glycerol-phosphate synthase subunit HisH
MINICIIDYGLGNTTSVYNAVRSLGFDVHISNNHSDIEKATHLILPGVGSFSSGMKKLQEFNLINILGCEVIGKKKPILGICLGMQLMASFGDENGRHQGLGWIKGEVQRMSRKLEGEKLPHMGWNDLSITSNSTLTRNIAENLVFYFVHSYHFIPENDSIVTGLCDYAGGFAAMIESENIFATQFHPEKSHNVGLQLIENFLKWEG